VTVHPPVALAAFAAGLVVGGGAYAASHDIGLGDGLTASAGARAKLSEQIPAGRARRRGHLLHWQAPHVPHMKPPPAPAPLVQVAAVPAVSPAPTAAPVTSTSPAPPVTRTSPTGGDDDGGEND
jgi:hypothetical protein